MERNKVSHESSVPDHATVEKPAAGFADKGAKESGLPKPAMRRHLD
jgi:hypothetical protein